MGHMSIPLPRRCVLESWQMGSVALFRCDVCKKIIEEEHLHYILRRKGALEKTVESWPYRIEDLCGGCADAVLAVMVTLGIEVSILFADNGSDWRCALTRFLAIDIEEKREATNEQA